MQFYNMAYIFLLLSSMYSPPFPHPHRYKHEQYGCCHKKQLIEIYLMWQFRFKKIPRKSNHNREWSCMTLSFAVPCQHIRINDIKNQRGTAGSGILKQQRCNCIHSRSSGCSAGHTGSNSEQKSSMFIANPDFYCRGITQNDKYDIHNDQCRRHDEKSTAYFPGNILKSRHRFGVQQFISIFPHILEK